MSGSRNPAMHCNGSCASGTERGLLKTYDDMTLSNRRILASVFALALAGCAQQRTLSSPDAERILDAAAHSLPSSYRSPADAPIAVRAEKINQDYSSINAQVLSDASIVDSTFVAAFDPNMPVTRLESSWTQQRIRSDEGWRIGDSISTSGMWGSSVRFGGVQYGTRPNLRQDLIAAPNLGAVGMAVLPSAADAFFTAAGASQAAFARSRLSIEGDVDVVAPNSLSFVAKDQWGRAQAISARLIAPIQLAGDGCNQFSIGLGRVRQDYGIVSNEYGATFASSTVTCGVPLGFTVEGHGEYLAEGVTAVGFGLMRKVGPLGLASITLASSKADVGSGWLARFGFDHENELFNLMVRTRLQSREFREVGSLAVRDPLMERALASLGVRVRDNSNLAVTYATQTTWAREEVNLIALSQSLTLGRTAVSMSAGHSLLREEDSSLFISFTRPFGFYAPTRQSTLDALEQSLLNGAAN